MAECGTYLDSEDIFRMIARTDGTYEYLNVIDSGVNIEDTEPVECWETITSDDILNLILDIDGDGNYGLNVLFMAATPPPAGGGLELVFGDISNITLEVGDVSDVANWNTFFGLPALGTPFTSVSVNANTVNLYGGGGITLDTWMFSDAYYPPKFYHDSDLISITDNDGVITTAGDYCFSSCTSLTIIDLPVLTTAGDDCFSNCTSLTIIDLPVLTTAGDGCFSSCTSLTIIDLPVLTTAGDACFSSCTSLTIIDLPVLTTAGDDCFSDCTSLTIIDLSSCSNLGSTTGNNIVFGYIIGNTITLTVPAALMTCDAGNPDGDIVDLDSNNTLTVVQV